MRNESCIHLEAVETVKHPKQHVCQECVKIGGTWVHLRTCQECGGTHCCDSSPYRHATKHAHATGHPVIASAEPMEYWLYRYHDDEYGEYRRDREECDAIPTPTPMATMINSSHLVIVSQADAVTRLIEPASR